MCPLLLRQSLFLDTEHKQDAVVQGQSTVLVKGLNLLFDKCMQMLSPMMEITIIAILYNICQPTILNLEFFSSTRLALCQQSIGIVVC